MRTTISLPDPLLERAKRRAAERGVTLSEVVEDALRMHLAGSGRAPAKPFRLRTVRGTLVNPGLDLDRTSELISMDDESEYGRGRT